MIKQTWKNLSGTAESPSIEIDSSLAPTHALDTNTSILDKLNQDDAAKSAVSLVGPRVYRLKGLQGTRLKFFVYGCSGSGKPAQRNLAKLMKNVAACSPESKPDFIINTGDMFYMGPLANPTDPIFKTNFTDIYEGLGPIFCALGNHEGPYSKESKYRLNNLLGGVNSELNTVAATYVPDGKAFKSTTELVQFFQQDELDLKKMQGFVMPFYYYAIQVGKVQLTFMNSNTLPKAYLNYSQIERLQDQIKSCSEETYQIPWLKKVSGKFSDFFQIHVMHNPRKPIGKRGQAPDTSLYLNANQQEALNDELKINTNFYHEYIIQVLKKLGLAPDLHLCAHEHLLDVINNKPFNHSSDPTLDTVRQICAGGGGGDLQGQKIFEYKDLGIAMSDLGFFEISVDTENPKDLQITLYILDRDLKQSDDIKPKHIIKFSLHDIKPIMSPSVDPRVETLRTLLLNACYLFFEDKETARQKMETDHQSNKKSLSKNTFRFWQNKVTNLAHDAVNYILKDYQRDDVDHLHDLMAALYNEKPPSFENILALYHEVLEKFSNKEIMISAVVKALAAMHKCKSDPNFDLATYMTLLIENELTPKNGQISLNKR